MNLTAEQLADVLISIHSGLCNEEWEGIADAPWTEMSRDQKKVVLAALKEKTERDIARWGTAPSYAANSALLLARLDLDAVERASAHEQTTREAYLKDGTEKQKSSRLKSAINDHLSQAVHFSARQIRAIDRRLAAKQLPLLGELSGKLNRLRAGILKRGKIRNDAEFYVVKEIVSDQASEVTDAERPKFELMLDAYEHRKTKK